MIIYLVNSDEGPVIAYKNREDAIDSAATGIAMRDRRKIYSENELDEIKVNLKQNYTGYEFWVESIELY